MKWICGAALAAGVSASAAFGQGAHCGNGPDIEATLKDRYGEILVGTGIVGQSGQTWAGLYVNPETGSWTLVQIAPTGFACLRLAGEDWNRIAYPPQGEDG